MRSYKTSEKSSNEQLSTFQWLVRAKLTAEHKMLAKNAYAVSVFIFSRQYFLDSGLLVDIQYDDYYAG